MKKETEDRIREIIREELGKQYTPSHPVWIDPRWYQPYYAPFHVYRVGDTV